MTKYMSLSGTLNLPYSLTYRETNYYICMCFFKMFFCSVVAREPPLQTKHRPETSSTKSQIFFSANPIATTAVPSTNTAGQAAASVTSTSAVRPTIAASVSPSVPAGMASAPRDQNSNVSNGSRDFYNEYMLLGDQSKFASNVVYHVRPHSSNAVCVILYCLQVAFRTFSVFRYRTTIKYSQRLFIPVCCPAHVLRFYCLLLCAIVRHPCCDSIPRYSAL